ncbi:ERG4/ERG24 ergosterol biosynthesis protein [Irpex rosettiformis]|uniref:ERG4/ERG24 ergosterol biosynthesis protein n=1 Tax=Irpex rosettiformis TaxID=378272 RepID=A0ACB8TWY3_9APHY|nr:ERG4/ERG24 ergosterol biosynthesis protein [Irpex rosettiformis]
MGITKQGELNPRTEKYEFLGPPGALLIILGVPTIVFGLYFGCSENSGGCPPPLAVVNLGIIDAVSNISWWKSLWGTQACAAYLAWYSFTVIAWFTLPGDWIEGTLMRDGSRKKYKINAFSTFLLALGLVFGFIFSLGPKSFTFIYERYVGLMAASFTMSIAQSLYCYISSFRSNKLLALGGNTGNPIYDFFIGRELNPSIGSFDLKSFNEVRPGLILWALIDISMACEQSVRRGGSISDSMALVVLFHILYIGDCAYNESAIFTTMDITTEGFGFMLAVAITWVPFVYSLQARYLVFNQIELGPTWTAVIAMINLTGYWIFRSANNEKNGFRNGRNSKNLKYINTEQGTKLLVSGWWGLCRHPNYLGDLLMALAWSLPTKFNTPVTYFYVSFFLLLLIHRQRRDDEHCEKKYGADWRRYMQLVPYRIFPYIY